MRITRFLRNGKVSAGVMIGSAAARTCARVRGRHVVAVQDTTSLRDDGARCSLQAHVVLAVDAESGAPLGLVDGQFLSRQGGRKASRHARPIEDKESRRWLDGAQAAAQLRAAGALCVTSVGDCENDIYEAFALKPAAVELVIRAFHDRALEPGPEQAGEGDEALLFARLAQAPQAGLFEIELPAGAGRPARRADLAVRYCQASISRPARPGAAGRDLPASVRLSAVETREIDPPAGVAPLHWRLLTTHQVDSFATARWVSELYRRRWLIEELFRTIKTRGFDIERVGIAQGPFEKLAAATLVAGVSVLALVKERDGAERRPLDDVFDPADQPALEAVSAQLEGKTARQKNPHPKASLAFAAWVCARLGGWTGYYGKPGPIVMLKGLHYFRAIQRGWTLGQNV